MIRVAFTIVIFAISSITKGDSAKILAVFPVPSVSHQIVFRPLTQELAKRGHELTIVTPDPAFPKGEAPENLTEIDVHDISYEVWRKSFLKTATGNKDDIFTQMQVIFGIYITVVEMLVQTKEFKEVLQKGDDYFDLILLEACVRPALVLSHVFKAPVIQVSSFGRIFGNYETVGAPVHPILYPTCLAQRMYNLTFWEKVTELYHYFRFLNYYGNHEKYENDMMKKVFGHDVPTLSELRNNVDMLFLNIHPIFEGNHPVPPSVIHMWGIHLKPEKELPEDLKTYLDSSKNGVIYFSFGTNVSPSILPPERIQMFINVFSQLPYDILWKWDKDILPGQSSNIKIGKWFPQSDLLRHPKIKLFITQGGLQSTDEAITAGVPLIGIPMLADQWYNTEKYVYHRIGMKLDLETLTEIELENSIDTVVKDDSYHRNIIKLKTLLLDQPQRPLDRAVWWTEHVLRHGGARHLRAPAANMSWAEYLELELVFVLLAALAVVTILSIFVLYSLYKFIRGNFLSSVKLKRQ